MSLYDELSSSAGDLFTRVDKFYAAANVFPERFRRAVCARLGAPTDRVQLRGPADSEPAWKWPLLTTLGADDIDPDFYFTFAITTILHPRIGEMAPIETAPIASVVWDDAVERCVDAYREMLSFDPFAAEGLRSPIGFEIAPAGR